MVVCPDLRGLGPIGDANASARGVSFAEHIKDVLSLVKELGGVVDLAGVSLGGRIALAVAAEDPSSVRRLVLSGVGLERDARGRAVLEGWKRILSLPRASEEARKDVASAYLWSAASAVYARPFLEKNSQHLPGWLDLAASTFNVEGALEVLKNTHFDSEDALSVRGSVLRLKHRPVQGLVLCGDSDVISPPEQAKGLAELAGFALTIIPSAGHMANTESPQAWAGAVKHFTEVKE
jgi:pimeloyl-ACP methyl ester carboxylesterase